MTPHGCVLHVWVYHRHYMTDPPSHLAAETSAVNSHNVNLEITLVFPEYGFKVPVFFIPVIIYKHSLVLNM